MPKKKKNEGDVTKYKTEMCTHWFTTGYCHFGDKCQFAHGKVEQANVVRQVQN